MPGLSSVILKSHSSLCASALFAALALAVSMAASPAPAAADDIAFGAADSVAAGDLAGLRGGTAGEEDIFVDIDGIEGDLNLGTANFLGNAAVNISSQDAINYIGGDSVFNGTITFQEGSFSNQMMNINVFNMAPNAAIQNQMSVIMSITTE